MTSTVMHFRLFVQQLQKHEIGSMRRYHLLIQFKKVIIQDFLVNLNVVSTCLSEQENFLPLSLSPPISQKLWMWVILLMITEELGTDIKLQKSK